MYKGYPLFNDTQNVKLRTWNRVATFISIRKDHGEDMAKSYAAQLDDIAKTQMKNLLDEIREKGYGTVRKSVIDSSQFN